MSRVPSEARTSLSGQPHLPQPTLFVRLPGCAASRWSAPAAWTPRGGQRDRRGRVQPRDLDQVDAGTRCHCKEAPGDFPGRRHKDAHARWPNNGLRSMPGSIGQPQTLLPRLPAFPAGANADRTRSWASNDFLAHPASGDDQVGLDRVPGGQDRPHPEELRCRWRRAASALPSWQTRMLTSWTRGRLSSTTAALGWLLSSPLSFSSSSLRHPVTPNWRRDSRSPPRVTALNRCPGSGALPPPHEG